MPCSFVVVEKNRIYKIKDLWEQLNEIHLRDSHFFKDHYETFTFENRCRKFEDIPEDHIRIEIIEDRDRVIGYCISTMEKGIGEIDSLFIEKEYRKSGYGSKLVENSVSWLKTGGCERIVVPIAEGHESVFGFYQKFRFYPRMTYLQMIE